MYMYTYTIDITTNASEQCLLICSRWYMYMYIAGANLYTIHAMYVHVDSYTIQYTHREAVGVAIRSTC